MRGGSEASTSSTSRSPPRKRAISSRGADGRAEADALGVRVGEVGEALEGEGEVGAAFGRGEGVDLVDDDGVDGAERLALAGAEDEVEGLGGGDEDLAGVFRLALAFALGGVAGADVDADRAEGELHPLRGDACAGEGGAEVAFDVVDEGFERGDVEDADAFGSVVGEFGERVDRVEERGERLPGAGGRDEERVLAGGDERPASGLDGRGAGEALAEPGPGGGGEGVHGGTMVRAGADRVVSGAGEEVGEREDELAGPEAVGFPAPVDAVGDAGDAEGEAVDLEGVRRDGVEDARVVELADVEQVELTSRDEEGVELDDGAVLEHFDQEGSGDAVERAIESPRSELRHRSQFAIDAPLGKRDDQSPAYRGIESVARGRTQGVGDGGDTFDVEGDAAGPDELGGAWREPPARSPECAVDPGGVCVVVVPIAFGHGDEELDTGRTELERSERLVDLGLPYAVSANDGDGPTGGCLTPRTPNRREADLGQAADPAGVPHGDGERLADGPALAHMNGAGVEERCAPLGVGEARSSVDEGAQLLNTRMAPRSVDGAVRQAADALVHRELGGPRAESAGEGRGR